MISKFDILDTVNMIRSQHLDVRCITMGLSLFDCIDPDASRCAAKVYDKIATCAKDLVKVGNEIAEIYGIPVVNKRVSVTPISLIGQASGGYLRIAEALDKAAAETGVDFIGGYTALVQKGMSAKELAAWIEQNRLRLNHWFFSTDLSSYVRGGRISRTAAFFGGVFEICPLLNMDNLGRLVPRRKIRTKKNVIREIVQRMVENADNGTDYSGKCYISMSACREDAEEVAKLVEARFPKLGGKVLINNVGGLIGSHTGPGVLAFFFVGTER